MQSFSESKLPGTDLSGILSRMAALYIKMTFGGGGQWPVVVHYYWALKQMILVLQSEASIKKTKKDILCMLL